MKCVGIWSTVSHYTNRENASRVLLKLTILIYKMIGRGGMKSWDGTAVHSIEQTVHLCTPNFTFNLWNFFSFLTFLTDTYQLETGCQCSCEHLLLYYCSPITRQQMYVANSHSLSLPSPSSPLSPSPLLFSLPLFLLARRHGDHPLSPPLLSHTHTCR